MTATRRAPRLGEPGYNLAALVYTDAEPEPDDVHGNDYMRGSPPLDPGPPPTNGDGPHSNGDFGPNGGSNGVSSGSTETAEATYNLALRVYGNGNGRSNGSAATSARAAVGVAPPAEAQVAANGNGRAAAAMPVAPPAGPPPAPVIAPPGGAPPKRFFERTFESFSVVPFRWFMLAMLGQFGAMMMQMLVRGWLVFELTGSYAALGIMSLANAVPMFIFSPFGGVLADRVSRKYVLQVGQLMNAAIAGTIAVLLFMDALTFTHLLASAAFQGFVWALMMPARQAMIPDVVGEHRLMNAVALNTAGMNVTRLAAPGLGGFMIAAFGAEWVYVLMAGGFLFATVTLLPVPAKRGSVSLSAQGGAAGRGSGGGARQTFRDLADAIRYIAGRPPLLAVLSANFVIVMFSMPYMMLLPGFVADVLDAGPERLGVLMTITGLGAVGGSLVIASMPSRRRGLILLLSSVLLGVSLIVFSFSTSFLLTAVVMIFIGLGQTGRMSLSNVLLQAYVDDEYRGRVMSVYMMEFSVVSFGVFLVGMLAGVIGIQWAIGATAIGLTIVSLAGLLYPRLRDLD